MCKTIIARVAAELGFAVRTEARSPDGVWTADGLARHPDWKAAIAVAIHVQLSRIPVMDVEDRQERYAAAGVRGCDPCGLVVTVCPSPSGCSRWPPIEHRLLSVISLNWAGAPLRSFDTVVRDVAGTLTAILTATGLPVRDLLTRNGDETGDRVSDDARRQLRLAPHTVCPPWNHPLSSRTAGATMSRWFPAVP